MTNRLDEFGYQRIMKVPTFVFQQQPNHGQVDWHDIPRAWAEGFVC